MNLRCNKILITGGSSGIGLAIAKRFLEAGAEILITGRDADKLKSIESRMQSPHLHSMVWDSANVSVCQENLYAAMEELGGLDGVVNNAAVGPGPTWLDPALTPAQWDTVIDTDLRGAFFLLRYAVNLMLERKIRGNILNIASNAACMDIVNPYGISKLSLLKLTHSFGKLYGSNGIIINGIAPGATFTPMIADYAKTEDQPYERHAIGRLIRTEEIAELAYYLMSDYGEIICGHTVVADGGDRAATI